MWIVLIIIIPMWFVVAYCWYIAMGSEKFDKSFFHPALVAVVLSFLFTGPFCFVVWITLLFQAISLSYSS